MENFKDYPSNELNGDIQHKQFFPNGYGVSIVQHNFSYESDRQWELAILKGTSENWRTLCYGTEITYDVIGDLYESEVNELCERVKNLTPESS